MRFIPCTTTASGSTSATASGFTFPGTGTNLDFSTRTNSARPPSMEVPCNDAAAIAHMCGNARVHSVQCPHSPVGRTATSCPDSVYPPNS